MNETSQRRKEDNRLTAEYTLQDTLDAVEEVWDATEGIWDVAEEVCTWCLIRAVHRKCPRDDNEQVKKNAERGDTDDDRRDSRVVLPKVAREGTAEQQECTLQHQWQ